MTTRSHSSLDVGEHVARDQHGTVAAELADQPSRVGTLRRVEADGRLVREQGRRIADEPGGEAHALAHAAGQRPDPSLADVASRARAMPASTGMPRIAAGRRAGSRRTRARARPSGRSAAPAAPGRSRGAGARERLAVEVEAVDERAARVGREDARQDAERRRLPAPFGPSSPTTSPRATRQRDAVDGGAAAEALGELRASIKRRRLAPGSIEAGRVSSGSSADDLDPRRDEHEAAEGVEGHQQREKEAHLGLELEVENHQKTAPTIIVVAVKMIALPVVAVAPSTASSSDAPSSARSTMRLKW
jgi:hypothetical protein